MNLFLSFLRIVFYSSWIATILFAFFWTCLYVGLIVKFFGR